MGGEKRVEAARRKAQYCSDKRNLHDDPKRFCRASALRLAALDATPLALSRNERPWRKSPVASGNTGSEGKRIRCIDSIFGKMGGSARRQGARHLPYRTVVVWGKVGFSARSSPSRQDCTYLNSIGSCPTRCRL